MAKQRLKRVFNDIYAQLDQIYDNAENTAVLEAQFPLKKCGIYRTFLIGLGIVTRKGENSICGQECFSVPGYIEEIEFLELKQGKMPQSEA